MAAMQGELADGYEAFRRRVFGDAVGESGLFDDDPAMVPELEWQSRWFRGDFGSDFTGTEGEGVRVVDFGWWNRSAGPDFLDAVVEVDGRACRGAIELDVDARDWERHRHAVNPDYAGVVLHLFFRRPEEEVFTRTPENKRVTQVLLDPAAAHGSAFTPPPAAARLGRCSRPLEGMEAAAVRSLLLAAARQRAREKAAAFHRNAAIHGPAEAWFQAVAEALGFHANRWPMRVLAQRLPLRLLQEAGEGAEAMLFGHAGFLEGGIFDGVAEETTRRYLRDLWSEWWRVRPAAPRPLDWKRAGVRPGNHPQRRLGALAALVGVWRRFENMLEADALEAGAAIDFLSRLAHPYWSAHYTLEASPLPTPVALIGRDRAVDFLGNVVLPARASRDPEMWAAYESLPCGSVSAAQKRAALRLLGRRPDAAGLQKNFAAQQGLLQVYRDFCLTDDSACEECLFPEQLARWPGV